MPARARTVGPEISERVASHLQKTREQRGWTRADLAAFMEGEGYQMSAALIYQIEKGVILGKGQRRVRLITVDELVAFITVFEVPPETTVRWLFGQA